MAERRIYIDEGPGEVRGVVAVDGRAERLLIERAGDIYPRLGARYRARAVRLDKGSGLALLDLGGGESAALRLKADRAPPTEGQALEVEIAIEPQGAKAAVARVTGPGSGAPELIGESLSFEARLQALAPGAAAIRGREARAMADEAEDEALAVEHPLPGGGSLAIEITRALTAVDVDLGAGGDRDVKRAARQANMNAIAVLARLLRLKALGGLVVIDLVGRGHDGPALAHAAQTAFGPEQPGVIIGPVTKFGTLELALPRRYRPVRDALYGADGRLSVASLGLRAMRAAETQAKADPGGRLTMRCAPDVAESAKRLLPALVGIIGARLEVIPDTTLAADAWEIAAR
jgi:hypothetical protein